MRDIIEQTLAIEKKTREQDLKESEKQASILSEREQNALRYILESKYWNTLPEQEKDRHSINFCLLEMTALTPGECSLLSTKANRLMESGDLFSKVLTEGMASSTTGDHEGAEDHGMYGQGEGPSTPSGDSDTGVSQKGEHGDKGVSDKKGYLDEEEPDGKGPPDVDGDGPEKGGDFGDDDGDGKPNFVDKDENVASAEHGDPKKAMKGYGMVEDHYPGDGDEGGAAKKPVSEDDVPQDAQDGAGDDERAAKGAYLKDGKKQMEAEHKTTASDPGEPHGRKGDDKPDAEQRGDVPNHPDYSAAQVKPEDPSNSDLNQGPSAVSENFEGIESVILSMLSEAGFDPGSEKWTKLYERGFSKAISERAKLVGGRLRAITEAMPDFIKKKIEDNKNGKKETYDKDGKKMETSHKGKKTEKSYK